MPKLETINYSLDIGSVRMSLKKKDHAIGKIGETPQCLGDTCVERFFEKNQSTISRFHTATTTTTFIVVLVSTPSTGQDSPTQFFKIRAKDSGAGPCWTL